MLPIGLPVLSVRNMISYFEFGSKYMGTGEALRWEDGKMYELPQDYADMLGWESMVGQISEFIYPHARESGMSIIIARHTKMSMIEMWQDLKKHRY